jgi:cytochrome P450
MNVPSVDLKNPDLYTNGTAHEAFTRLRRECPVYWNPETDGTGFWALTKYTDIVAVSKDPALFSSARARGGHRIFNEHEQAIGASGDPSLFQASMIRGCHKKIDVNSSSGRMPPSARTTRSCAPHRST